MNAYNNESDIKTDLNGLAYTSESGFADFVHDFLLEVKAATTKDIVEYVRDNFDFLEGDIVKTSESRSSLRYRQMVDNLIKCHGTILRLYPDLVDFDGGICLSGVELSEDLIVRAKFEMSPAAKRAAEMRLQKEIEMRENELKAIKANKILKECIIKSGEMKNVLLKAAGESGADLSEVREYFSDIIADVAHRHPDAVANDEDFLIAFVAEC